MGHTRGAPWYQLSEVVQDQTTHISFPVHTNYMFRHS